MDSFICTGSDIVPNCNICKNNNADGFCPNCLKYMCLVCFNHHCVFKEFKNHEFIGKDKMPIRNISDDTIDSKCECGNEDTNVEFYCESHEKLLCTYCIIGDHKHCKFYNLSVRSKDVEKPEGYSKLLSDLSDAEKQFETEKNISKRNKDKCNDSFENIYEKLRCLKKDLQDMLDTAEKLQQKTYDQQKRYEKHYEDIANSNATAINKIREKRYDLSMLQDMFQYKKLFIALHRSKTFLNDMKQKMDKINRENTEHSFLFAPNDLLESVLADNTIGTITQQETSDSDGSQSKCQVYPEYVFPKCMEVTEDSFIIVDYVHKKLEKVTYGEVQDQLKLSSGPWDIAKISNTRVVVTQPQEEKIIFVDFKDESIRIYNEINVNCRCEGVVHDGHKVYIASSKPAAIVIYDVSQKKEVNRIEYDENHHFLFQQPAYININSEKQLVCVSDRKSNKVFIFNCSGSLSRVFESDDMKMPLAVSFRKDDVVVQGYQSSTINIISLDERKKPVITTRFLSNLQIENVFSNSTFATKTCWKYCLGRYLPLICKSTKNE